MKGSVPAEAGTANTVATDPHIAEPPFIDSPQAELELEPVSSPQPDHSMPDTNKSKV